MRRDRTGQGKRAKATLWEARYRAPDGRERSKLFERRIDAEQFLVSIESSKLRGEWIDPRRSKTLLADWAGRWLATTTDVKPKTRAGYESLLRTRILPTFGQVPIGAIEPEHVGTWVGEMVAEGLSASRVRQAYRVLSSVMKAAVISRYLVSTPCIGVRLPRFVYREMYFLSAEQVEDLAKKAPSPYDTLIYLFAYGGLRWGEAAALRRRRCDLLRSRIEIAESVAEVGGEIHFGSTKTYQARRVPLPPFLRDLIAEHLAEKVPDDPEAFVFAGPASGPLRNNWFWRRVWRPAVGAANVPEGLRVHDLRHTCAALLIAHGAHPKAVQVHLGHSTIAITMDRYGHLFPDEMDRIAEGLEDVRNRALAQQIDREDRREGVALPSLTHTEAGR